MKNAEIRKRAKQAGVNLWEIAEKLGIWDSAFSKMLRYELPEVDKQRIYDIIDELKAGDQMCKE